MLLYGAEIHTKRGTNKTGFYKMLSRLEPRLGSLRQQVARLRPAWQQRDPISETKQKQTDK